MPIARDFLETFGRSTLAEERWVFTGSVLTYARDNYGIPVEDFYNSGIDIEALHSEVEGKLIDALQLAHTNRSAYLEATFLHSTYVQLIFVFAAMVNVIQNGPPSEPHKNLSKTLQPEDAVVTFNWDTLMDRALAETTAWTPDNGYGFTPYRVYRNAWHSALNVPPTAAAPTLLKLHGSSNWITSYPGLDPDSKTLSLMQTAPADRVSVYEYTREPYCT